MFQFIANVDEHGMTAADDERDVRFKCGKIRRERIAGDPGE